MTRIRYKNKKTIIQVQASETGKPGPVFRIRTRPRLSEVSTKLNSFRSRTLQAPYSGSDVFFSFFHNSLSFNFFRSSAMALKAGTIRLFSPLSQIQQKVPRLGAQLTLGAMLGAGILTLAGSYVFPMVADAAPGTYIGRQELSTSKNPTGASYSPEDGVSWVTDQGHIYKGKESDFSLQTIVNSISDTDAWKFLAEKEIDGKKYFATLNDTTNNIFIFDAENGTVWSNWTYPEAYPDYISGLDFNDNDNLWVYNRATGFKKIEEYSTNGTHLDTIEIPPLTLFSGKGINLNKNDGSISMNLESTGGCYSIWTSGTEIIGHDTLLYTTGPLVNRQYEDITHNPLENILYVVENVTDPSSSSSRNLVLFEGPVTPTPIPTPSRTPSPVPTKTPEPTPSLTLTPTPTVTATPSTTPTPYIPTSSPSLPPTPTVTATPSTTPTPYIPTPSPTLTPKPTVTPSPSITPTISPTPSITPSPTPIYTKTPTITPTPSITPIATSTPETLESKIGIFRPSTGLWAIKGVTRNYFGGSRDIPIYEDFNGNGTTNQAIFRPSSGLWAVKGLTRNYFGGSNDTPVPGDYDGDGTVDQAIFRPSTGLWAVKGLTRNYFGNSDDTPVPGDWNGDGTAEPAIFRPSTGLWAAKGITRFYFGGSDDTPIPGDYAGGGISSIGIFRPASGLWAIRGVSRIYFGGSSDQPVPGDYAGDGTEDIGIFRDSSGLWAIRGLSRCYFGGVGDIPVTR